MRRTPIRRRSKATEAVYRERRALVARLLEERPWCEFCKTARSTVIHEVITRARGGDILDPVNCRALCHESHAWIHDNPLQATAEGWLKKRPVPDIQVGG